MTTPIRRTAILTAFLMLAWQVPAYAHHAMDGDLPQTFVQGLLSGLAHPIIGLDHLAAIVGVGALAGIAGRGVAPVLAFSAAMMAGVAMHLGRIDLPGGELLVGLATLGIGALLILRIVISPVLAVALFAVAGLIHGHALGESIVGAEPAPIVAYLAGLFIVQTAIGLGACLAAQRLASRARTLALSAAGTAVALIGGAVAASAAGLAA
ncbi:HupE/UreJ family protein [Reyranella sp.]|uniref:HupE/UreJ family protein n=1 Tax=Reyranella sp. TaxID=1929291 RepID=UPI0012193D6A|nr:HupE/UreJ family protein [Reyranella sp.]TAJ86208.1 MAG: urease accessory protein UreJ [Reyranella sp.]